MTGIATIVDQVLGRSVIPPGARPVTPPQARFDVPQAAAPRSKKRPAPKSNRFRIRGFVTAAFDAGTPCRSPRSRRSAARRTGRCIATCATWSRRGVSSSGNRAERTRRRCTAGGRAGERRPPLTTTNTTSAIS